MTHKTYEEHFCKVLTDFIKKEEDYMKAFDKVFKGNKQDIDAYIESQVVYYVWDCNIFYDKKYLDCYWLLHKFYGKTYILNLDDLHDIIYEGLREKLEEEKRTDINLYDYF